MDYRKMAREVLDGLPAYKPPPVPERPLTDAVIAQRVLIDIHRRLLESDYGNASYRLDPGTEVQPEIFRDAG